MSKQNDTVVDKPPGFTMPLTVAVVVPTDDTGCVVTTGAPVVVKEATLP